MQIQILGYNKVQYSKDGENRDFYKFYVLDPSVGKITSGQRCFEVMSSTHYAETKLLPAISDGTALHLGWKDGRSFLYAKK